MPFISSNERPSVAHNPTLASKPGHLAFLIYKEIKRIWKDSPSWTTASKIHSDFVQCPDDNVFLESLCSQTVGFTYTDVLNASNLSWQVFFMECVYPYEVAKKRENGDVQ